MTTWAWLPAWTVAMADEADVPLPALTFTPTDGTRARLADLGLIFRARPDGFALFVRFVGGRSGVRQTALPAAETRLSFAIGLADATFPDRFRPALSRTTGPQLYFTNRSGADAVRPSGRLTRGTLADTADACRIVARRFPAPLASGVATSLKVRTAFAPVRDLPDIPLNGGAGELAVAVDLTAAPERAFTLTPTPGGSAITVVADDELAGRGAFGLLDLFLRRVAGPDPAAGRFFTAKFRRT